MILEISKVGPAIKEELASTVYENIDLSLFFYQNKNDLIEVALFGGAIRDMFLFGHISEESDLDFVVKCDKYVLKNVIKKFNPIENKFGGFRFEFGNRIIDIWSLSETWAIKKGFVSNSDGMMSLLETTFFNVDAAYYRLFEDSLICSKKFRDGISERKLRVNFEINPSPLGIQKRIQEFSSAKNFELENSIHDYLYKNSY